ncbi:DUF2382 domain-containing protein [Alsobacter sp. SYSU BS001988]|jgi:stress response protein YsnF
MSDSVQAGTATPTDRAQHTVAALFDSRAEAERAVDALIEEGFDRDDVRLMPESERDHEGSDLVEAPRADTGFWASLRDMFFPEEDRHVYAEGLRRGGYLVSVRTSPEHYEKAIDILDDEGTIDLDEREAAWRTQGWSGYAGSDYEPGSSLGGDAAPAPAPARTEPASRPAAMTTTEDAFNVEGGRQGEQVIPIAEETLRVGKRIARGGQVRVRSYVVETPVSEQVNLRDEHVTIERRPADRRLSGAEDPFRERTVEMDEAREEPVVSKEARVREELVVNKDVETRNETVSDKVRRTEVEVQDDRNARSAGTGGEPGRR